MSQNSLVINDASGAAVLAAINAALDSLASNNSGAGSPAITYPYMWWPDTGNGVLKQRNAANNGWIVRAPLAESLVVTRSANAALAVGDFARCIIASGTWTQTFAAAATLGDGWFIEYRNNGSGVITLDPNASETIDGSTTVQLAPGEACSLYCNGTAFYTVGRTASALQSQAATAFTSADTAPSFTLTPVPAITAYAANQRFRVKFHAAGAGSNTMNVSGLGAKNLCQYDSGGNKVAAVIAANQLADLEYDGTDFVILDPLPPVVAAPVAQSSVIGASSNLRASATGANSTVTVSANEIVLESSGNAYAVARAVSVSINSAAVGVNGLDAGVLAASTWYSVWVIWNGAAVAGLLSLSANAPTMPSGYTHKARVGWIRTDGTANKYPLSFTQFAKRVQYKIAAGSNLTALPAIASGAVGTFGSAWGVASTANAIPPTAAVFLLSMSSTSGGSGALWLAPNTACGFNALGGGFYYGPAAVAAIMVAINAENASVAVSSQTNTAVGVFGWEDNL